AEAEKARQNEEKAKQNAQRAKQSQKETAKALAKVESQKEAVEGSLSKAEKAEEAGRKLLYTTDMRLAPFVWRDDRTTAEQLRVLLAKHVPERQKAEGRRQKAKKRQKSGSSVHQSTRRGSPDPAVQRKPDLRGFEWHYYQHLLKNSATVF